MIDPARIHWRNAGPPRTGAYVLYWMQQAQRAEFNHALELAIGLANELGLPLLTGFALTGFPEANQRHYRFMLEGLRETEQRLNRRGIGLCVRQGPPEKVIPELARSAAVLICDAGVLRVQREWRDAVADRIVCPMAEVETDWIVPLAMVSDHEEYAARTIRPKINRQLDAFLRPLKPIQPTHASVSLVKRSLSLQDPARRCRALNVDESVGPSPCFAGGRTAASRRLDRFIRHPLATYPETSRDPVADGCSQLSAYLHFGQISPLEIALRIKAADVPSDAVEKYLEQLIIRRELSMNACRYNPGYDQYRTLPEWARRTLDEHRKDKRADLYTRAQWEAAATHDPCWNAAQMEMVQSGQMHNSMRMYWGKKLIEWSATPEEAFETALFLNNKYELDGRDANGFTGVAWCFGRHDRAWTERPVFGKIRYMNANGLHRKFDIQAYVVKWTSHRLRG